MQCRDRYYSDDTLLGVCYSLSSSRSTKTTQRWNWFFYHEPYPITYLWRKRQFTVSAFSTKRMYSIQANKPFHYPAWIHRRLWVSLLLTNHLPLSEGKSFVANHFSLNLCCLCICSRMSRIFYSKRNCTYTQYVHDKSRSEVLLRTW